MLLRGWAMGIFKKQPIAVSDAQLMAERDEAQERCIMLRADLVDARQEIDRLNAMVNSFFAANVRARQALHKGTSDLQRKARKEGYIPGTAMGAMAPEDRPVGRCVSCVHAVRVPGKTRNGWRHQAECAIHPKRRINCNTSPSVGGWCPDYERKIVLKEAVA